MAFCRVGDKDKRAVRQGLESCEGRCVIRGVAMCTCSYFIKLCICLSTGTGPIAK